MAEQRRKRGRPPGGEFVDKSEVVHFRIRPDTKELLVKAAAASGRTVSQECEHRLLRGLEDFGGDEQTTTLLRIWARAIRNTRNLRDPEARWWSDPYLYEQAIRAFTALAKLLRPAGALPPTLEEALDLGGPRQGEISIELTLREIQSVDPAKPLTQQTKHERWLNGLRKDLGLLADRPEVWGRSADYVRAEKAFAESLEPQWSEYISLRGKQGFSDSTLPDEEREQIELSRLTPEERDRYLELRQEITGRIAEFRKRMSI
jgi:hypothetical protein